MESKTRRRCIFSKIGIFTALGLGGIGEYSFADIRSSRGAIQKEVIRLNESIMKTTEKPMVNKIIGIRFIFFFSTNSFSELPEM